MKSISLKIIGLYRRLADHTFSDCQKHCTEISNCCSVESCEAARQYSATHYGYELSETGHPTLPFMGPLGCTLEPHLRPACTEFVCCIRDHREKPGDPAWTKTYYDIRRDILLTQMAEGDQQ